MMRRPNLFLVGSIKSGTTSLWAQLKEHPDIFAPKRKEPRFFLKKAPGLLSKVNYLNRYSAARNEKFLIDASPQYSMYHAYQGVAERIYHFNPEAKIIYLVRDPLQRLLSHYRYYLWNGFEHRSLHDALSRESGYLSSSYYAFQLAPYVRLFGKKSVLVVTTESFAADPKETCRAIFSWLGIDPEFTPESIGKRFMVTPQSLSPVDGSSILVKIWARLKRNRNLTLLLPGKLRRKVRDRLPKTNKFDVRSAEFQSEANLLRAALCPLLKRWTEEFSTLTGRAYPEWCFNFAVEGSQGEEVKLLRSRIWMSEAISKEKNWLRALSSDDSSSHSRIPESDSAHARFEVEISNI